MSRGITFKNRSEAGKLLGKELDSYRIENPVVLAIPRGGVEVGYQVALQLQCEFMVVVARKLGYLNQPEAAFGALAEDGSLYLNSWIRKKLSRDEISIVMKREKKEIERRVKMYRKGEPLISLRNRTVIIVDDGIATGSTLFAVIELCKKQQPDKIVVAVPVCGKERLHTLIARVDDVVVLSIPEPYYAVSQAYAEFPGFSDDKVVELLDKWQVRAGLMETLNHDP
jgi:putative phosphoribosyl transferase